MVQLRQHPITAGTSVTGQALAGPKSIIDGDLLNLFINLPHQSQKELAKSVGSNIDRIMDDLLEVHSVFEYF